MPDEKPPAGTVQEAFPITGNLTIDLKRPATAGRDVIDWMASRFVVPVEDRIVEINGEEGVALYFTGMVVRLAMHAAVVFGTENAQLLLTHVAEDLPRHMELNGMEPRKAAH